MNKSLNLIHPSSLIPHPSDVVAVLLAAGRSRRMGAFKPLLPFGHQTVIETCVSNLLEGGAESVVVVVGHRADEVCARLAHLPVSFAVNPDPESEMGTSIAAGVEAVSPEAESFLIALVDYPAVPSSVVSLLIDAWGRERARIVAPLYQGRGGHPVLIDAGLRSRLLNLDRERGLRALFEECGDSVLRINVDTPYVARDMDTWDDYSALYLEVFGELPPKTPA